jgi:hypothetical protein
VAHTGDVRVIQSFGGKPEGKKQLGRPRCRWDDNVTLDHQNVGWKDNEWIYLPQGREK